MNEVEEIPIEDHPYSHTGSHLCICQPDVYCRYQNGQQIGTVIRHHRHVNQKDAMVRAGLIRGY